MNTTNFYVELIVIGLGPFISLVLIASAIFAIDPGTLAAFASWSNFVMLLPIIYLLGIITDRGADALFAFRWEDKLKQDQTEEERREARFLILTKGEKISELIEYGRSRMRICRGWAFNCPLLMVSFPIYAVNGKVDLIGIVFVELALAGLMIAAWYSWRALAGSDYQKVKNSGVLLNS